MSSESSKLLTIAVPTFERLEFLKTTLLQLVTEVAPYADLIDLMVADNHSQDGTKEFLESLRNTIPHLRIFRHERNIGAESNFCFCLNQRLGRYFWLFGDDDILVSGVIPRIIHILGTQPDILFLEHAWFSGNPPDSAPTEQVHWESTRDARAFTNRLGEFITFISAMIIDARALDPERITPFIGTFLIQFSWILPLVKDENRMCVLPGVNIHARGANGRDYTIVKVFGNNLASVLDKLTRQGIAIPSVARDIRSLIHYDFLPNMLMSKSGNLDSSASTQDLAEVYPDRFLYRKLLQVAIAPHHILKGRAVRIVRWIGSKRRAQARRRTQGNFELHPLPPQPVPEASCPSTP